MNTVLVVDDEASIRMLLKRVLSMAGYEVIEAPDGSSALELAATHEPALVILDLSMPGLSGLNVCRLLKENPFTAAMPVLMLTAQSGLDWKLQGFDAGADDYLAKPFEPRELVARVRALLRLVRREADRNPSSGLPGGEAIARELERRARAEAFSVVYFDIDWFKPFADAWGFAVADRAIAACGRALREAARECEEAFVGHIGGDDFIGGCAPSRAEAFARDVLRRFDHALRALLCETPEGVAACERGTFAGADRDGRSREFPLPRLSASVVSVDPQRWKSPGHLGAFAASMKRQAKQSADGVVSGALA